MRRHRSTKIIATLGPASSTVDVIEDLFLSGVDLFRLNFSHGTHEGHKKNIEIIRALSKKQERPIGIMQDLQGPKLRIGTFEKGSETLKKGDIFHFSLDPVPGTHKSVTLPHPEIFRALCIGATLLIDDGKLSLIVENCSPTHATARVINGGVISDRKGVNVPDVTLPLSALTKKDREDLAFGLTHGVDYVALSFVQKPEDIVEAKELIQGRAKIISKLEKPNAIHHLEDIVSLSDAIMVARGDLGVELPPEEVPSLQKRIIRTCRMHGKPVIVATQMLDSMVFSPTPTRAEASDVATAVYDGVDAVMLSAESASGQFPIASVAMMNRIIERVEADPLYRENLERSRLDSHTEPGPAIAAAARQVAHMIEAKVIVTLSAKGDTSLRAAYERPEAPILALTPSEQVAAQLTLAWGCHPCVIPQLSSSQEVMEQASKAVTQEGFAQKGDQIVITAGSQFASEKNAQFRTGSTRVLRILTLGEEI